MNLIVVNTDPKTGTKFMMHDGSHPFAVVEVRDGRMVQTLSRHPTEYLANAVKNSRLYRQRQVARLRKTS